jgi:hypothetical protein
MLKTIIALRAAIASLGTAASEEGLAGKQFGDSDPNSAS